MQHIIYANMIHGPAQWFHKSPANIPAGNLILWKTIPKSWWQVNNNMVGRLDLKLELCNYPMADITYIAVSLCTWLVAHNKMTRLS